MKLQNECPKCHWNPFYWGKLDKWQISFQSTGFYTIKKGLKKKKYPIRFDYKKDLNISIGRAYDTWKETHFCPKCKIEFTLSNSEM